jgi:hypothetical protein
MGKNTIAKVRTVEAFDGTPEELKRAIYVTNFLQTGSRAEACKASGLKPRCHSRIVQMYVDRGHAFDSPRSGRPAVYTADMMEAAYDVLVNNEGSLLTGKQLQQKLVQEGLLHPNSDSGAFMSHLRQYIESQGHRLITNSTQTTFFLARSDVSARQAFVNTMMEELRSTSLESIIWADETILEECPHPKGTSCRHAVCPANSQ